VNPYPSDRSWDDASRLIICFPSRNGNPEIVALVTDTAVDFIPKQVLNAIRSALHVYHDEDSWIVRGFINLMKYVMVGNTVNDDYWANRREWAVLDALTVKHGFKWIFLGWDEEPRLVAHGAARTAHPKIIIDYEGRYVIKPRCRLCHQRTGWCRCFETLGEAVECLEGERHYCDECSKMLTLESWLKGKHIINGLDSFWNHLLENVPLLTLGLDTEDDVIDLETVVLYFDDWYDQWLMEESENWDYDDDTYCECPLEG
jgi:hypothetical protein